MSKPAVVSFEFFPPGDAASAVQLWSCIEQLAPFEPSFVSVTYGADGSTRSRTRECVMKILRETRLTAVPHLTCIAAAPHEVLGVAQDYWQHGVRRLVALRGDAPASRRSLDGSYRPQPGGFAYASELVQALRGMQPFEISVAAYPEGHPESGGIEDELANLRRKVEAGAVRAITQFCFDTDVFLRYRDRCAAAGIRVPLAVGILPVTRLSQLLRFAARCGATVPAWVRERFEGLEGDNEAHAAMAATVAIEQVLRLRSHGVHEFHFYTLNRADVTSAVCQAMGLRARRETPAATQRLSAARISRARFE